MKRILTLLALALTMLPGAQAQRALPSVSILGDSYSTFKGYLTPDTMETWYSEQNDTRRTDVNNVSQTWWWQVIRRMNWKLEVNNSWSGSTICNTGYHDEDRTHKSFLTRLPHLGSPDVILVFGGTNDAWANVPLGDYMYEGWRRANLYFFRPALCYMLAQLQERYPTAQLCLISNCDLNTDITTSIHEACRHYGVPVAQLHDIDKTSSHPNRKGMTQIATQVVEALSAICTNNP